MLLHSLMSILIYRCKYFRSQTVLQVLRLATCHKFYFFTTVTFLNALICTYESPSCLVLLLLLKISGQHCIPRKYSSLPRKYSSLSAGVLQGCQPKRALPVCADILVAAMSGGDHRWRWVGGTQGSCQEPGTLYSCASLQAVLLPHVAGVPLRKRKDLQSHRLRKELAEPEHARASDNPGFPLGYRYLYTS